MGTTASGYPYPEDTDTVTAGAQATKALATAVDKQLGRGIASGSASLVFNGTVTSVTVTVQLPAGRFTAPPNVVASSTHSAFFAAVSSITATSFSLTLHHYADAKPASTYTAQWIAVKGSP